MKLAVLRFSLLAALSLPLLSSPAAVTAAGVPEPAAPAENTSVLQWCWDVCDGTQDCDMLCNLGGGVSTCGQEGHPCCTSESGVESLGARWNAQGLWCRETAIGKPGGCRTCPYTGTECWEGPCQEYYGGWAFGYSCSSLNWGQQYC